MRTKSGRPGASMRSTSAPKSAKIIVAYGPGSRVEKSRILREAKGAVILKEVGLVKENRFLKTVLLAIMGDVLTCAGQLVVRGDNFYVKNHRPNRNKQRVT